MINFLFSFSFLCNFIFRSRLFFRWVTFEAGDRDMTGLIATGAFCLWCLSFHYSMRIGVIVTLCLQWSVWAWSLECGRRYDNFFKLVKFCELGFVALREVVHVVAGALVHGPLHQKGRHGYVQPVIVPEDHWDARCDLEIQVMAEEEDDRSGDEGHGLWQQVQAFLKIFIGAVTGTI